MQIIISSVLYICTDYFILICDTGLGSKFLLSCGDSSIAAGAKQVRRQEELLRLSLRDRIRSVCLQLVRLLRDKV
jgi:hypothetical protein